MSDERRITVTIDDEEIRTRVPAEDFEIIVDKLNPTLSTRLPRRKH